MAIPRLTVYAAIAAWAATPVGLLRQLAARTRRTIEGVA
jgi:hypothetical protein